jgi:DNA mismatch repair protein PMS2
MLESLREALGTLFNAQDYAMPASHLSSQKQSSADAARLTSLSMGPPSSTANSKKETSIFSNGSSRSQPRSLRYSSDHSSKEGKDQSDESLAEELEENDDDEGPPAKRVSAAKSPSRDAPVSTLLSRWAASAPVEDESSSPARTPFKARPSSANDQVNNGTKPDFQGQSLRISDRESNAEPIKTNQTTTLNGEPHSQLDTGSSEERYRISDTGTRITYFGTSQNSAEKALTKPKVTTIGKASLLSAHHKNTISTTARRPPPSFGGRLSQIFSAGASKEAGSGTDLKRKRTPVTDEEELESTSGEGEVLSDEADDVNDDDEMADAGKDAKGHTPEEVLDNSHSAVESPSEELPDSTPAETGAEEEEEEEEEEVPTAHLNIQNVTESIPAKGDSSIFSRSDMSKRSQKKDATVSYAQHVRLDVDQIASLQYMLQAVTQGHRLLVSPSSDGDKGEVDADDAEEKLSLTISKGDFGRMKIVGQFNLGFILAVRPAHTDGQSAFGPRQDELFIIDQHATDEKYNFERLQRTTVVQSQRLVHFKTLDLTALEEEVVIENLDALEKNGFKVAVDESGESPVGERCKLLALPLSRETTFTLADLEELIALLQDHQSTSDTALVPRPSKVRKMFAMRACRSSIMIGKALAQKQMEKVVRHMEELDKPWNCPHGRPTMRHLCSLKAWDEQQVWEGGDWDCPGSSGSIWSSYLADDGD